MRRSKSSNVSNLFRFDGVRVGILICYDVEFPEAVRTVAMKGADIVIVPTANFHPYDFINDRLIEVRAFENSVPIVYCNWSEHKNTVAPKVEFNGKSIVADANGKALLRLRPTDEGLWIVNVPVRSRNTESTESDCVRDRRPELYSVLTCVFDACVCIYLCVCVYCMTEIRGLLVLLLCSCFFNHPTRATTTTTPPPLHPRQPAICVLTSL